MVGKPQFQDATDGYPGGSGGGTAYRAPAVGYGYNPSTPSTIVSWSNITSLWHNSTGYPGGGGYIYYW